MCCGITRGVGREEGEKGAGEGGSTSVLVSGLHSRLCLYGLISCNLLSFFFFLESAFIPSLN